MITLQSVFITVWRSQVISVIEIHHVYSVRRTVSFIFKPVSDFIQTASFRLLEEHKNDTFLIVNYIWPNFIHWGALQREEPVNQLLINYITYVYTFNVMSVSFCFALDVWGLWGSTVRLSGSFQRHPSMPGGNAVIYCLKVIRKTHSDLIKSVGVEVSLSWSMTFSSQECERPLSKHCLPVSPQNQEETVVRSEQQLQLSTSVCLPKATAPIKWLCLIFTFPFKKKVKM